MRKISVLLLLMVLFFPALSLGEASGSDVLYPTPAKGSAYPCDHENCYWNLPMDITNEQAIWDAMMESITVLSGPEKEQYKLLAEPQKDAEPVGQVNYESQGVHVLKTLDNGWTFVEVYSTAFSKSTVKVYGDFVQGYVETSLLKEKTPPSDYGILVDKLTQRLYLFQEGKIFTTLLVSTGVNPGEKPYQETQSGEFVIVSFTGVITSGKLIGPMALRYNGLNLIHEVPYVKRGETNDYSQQVANLGERASHGCIRVQRARTPEGVNHKWIWDNRVMNAKIWIWEDFAGRQIDMPSDDHVIYYNPDGGKSYHKFADKCFGVRDRYLPMTAITYGELGDSSYEKLTPCTYCNPPMRPEDIEAKNAEYAL